MTSTRLAAQHNPSLMRQSDVAGTHTSAGHRMMLEACRAIIKVLGWDTLNTIVTAIAARYTALNVAPSAMAGGVPRLSSLEAPVVGVALRVAELPQYDGIPKGTITYQWISGASTDISGATSASYTPVVDDIGETLKCEVTVTNGVGSSLVQTTEATAAVVDAE